MKVKLSNAGFVRVLSGACVLVMASIALAASSPAFDRGWLPMIALAGARDPDRAIHTLRGLSQFLRIVQHHTEFDAATRDFLDRASSSIQDFNLRRLHDLLPEQKGRFRQLLVSAAVSGQRYLVSRTSAADAEVGPRGARQRLGDASIMLRAAPVTSNAGDTNYLLQGRAGVVVGQIGWPMVVDGIQQFLTVLTVDSHQLNASPTGVLRRRLHAQNPSLGDEDIEPLATLSLAYPRTANVLSKLGRIDDLITRDAKDAPGIEHVHAVLHFDTELVSTKYPEIADYLENLNKLVEVDLRWLDSHDQTLATLHVNSHELSARLDLYLKSGMIVPTRHGAPIVEQTLDAQPGVFRFSVRAAANLHVLGVRAHVRGGRIDFEHERTERGMELRGHMTRPPHVAVSGAALGIVPTGLVDLIIPGDIQSLFEKTVATACHGNDGKGVEIKLRFDQRPLGFATLDGALALEAIDNFLIKVGVSYFSDHVIPDDDTSLDISRLLNDLHDAFSADLEHYASTRETKAH